MKPLNRWVLWKYSVVNGKLTKIPYKADKSGMASSTDESTWTNFFKAYAQTSEKYGLGFVFVEKSHFMGIDIDHIETPEQEAKAQEIIAKFNSYTEKSPSGKGYHIYIKAKKTTTDCRSKEQGLDLEFYDKERFFTVTGNSVHNPALEVVDAQNEENWFEENFVKKPLTKTNSPVYLPPIHTPSLDDEKIIKLMRAEKTTSKAMLAYDGDISAYPSGSEADGALALKIAFYTQDPDQIKRIMHTSQIVRDKWNRADYLDRHITTALEKTTETYTPPIEIDDIDLKTIKPSEIWDEKTNRVKKKLAPSLTPDQYKEVFERASLSFRLNEINDEIEVNGQRLSDVWLARIIVKLNQLGVENQTKIINNYTNIAYENRYHPIKQYLKSLVPDPSQTIDTLTSYVSDADGLFAPYFKKWIVGSVAKVFEPQESKTLILNGNQRMGKSYFVRWIGSVIGQEYCSESLIGRIDKDTKLELIKKWVWEIPEIGSLFSGNSSSTIKQFLTQDWISERPAYGRYNLNKPVITSFIGTVNNTTGLFSDPTGNTRFIVTTLVDIDKSYSQNVSPHKIWADAYKLYKEGFDYKFSKEELAMSELNNAKYDEVSEVEEYMLAKFNIDPNAEYYMNTTDVFDKFKDSFNVRHNKLVQEIGRVLKKYGVERKRKRDGDDLAYVYIGLELKEKEVHHDYFIN